MRLELRRDFECFALANDRPFEDAALRRVDVVNRPCFVIADVEVEVAVAIDVGEGYVTVVFFIQMA